MLLAAVILFRPGAGLNVLAQEPQSAAGTAVQTDVSAQEAAAAAQAEADALMAAHLAAWQQAQQEYAAQLAAYQQALAQQFGELRDRMDQQYSQHHQAWEDALFARCLGR